MIIGYLDLGELEISSRNAGSALRLLLTSLVGDAWTVFTTAPLL